jgi:hypothetical protein
MFTTGTQPKDSETDQQQPAVNDPLNTFENAAKSVVEAITTWWNDCQITPLFCW